MTNVVKVPAVGVHDGSSDGNPAPHPNPRKPSLVLPPGSVDSHCHVFGPRERFPYAPGRTFTPVDATREQVTALQAHLGFERAVIVQSSCYGSDHRALIDALAAAPGTRRGIALIRSRTPRDELDELAAAGVVGARLHFMSHLGVVPDQHEQSAVLGTIAELGWHVEVHVDGDGVAEHQAMISSVRSPVVIDHMGRVDLREGLSGRSVRAMLELLDTGTVWIKLSGVDRVSLTGPPFADAAALGRLLVQHAPERVLWGTDYPHPNVRGAAPDDGLLVDLIGEMAPTEALREQLLVTNPVGFFGF